MSPARTPVLDTGDDTYPAVRRSAGAVTAVQAQTPTEKATTQ
ncbi:hypothetical protein [Streptomyces acidicola]|nr:hypothetical protein [Streptomyces acidicola]